MTLVRLGDRVLRPVNVCELEEVTERDERIRQLEKQCAVLAMQVDKQRPVVEAACNWSSTYDDGAEDGLLLEAVTEYYGAIAAYEAVKEGGDGQAK